MNFTSTWGDPHYLGLTGLEIIGASGETVPINIDNMNADPRDLHVLPGYENDERTLDKWVLSLVLFSNNLLMTNAKVMNAQLHIHARLDILTNLNMCKLSIFLQIIYINSAICAASKTEYERLTSVLHCKPLNKRALFTLVLKV